MDERKDIEERALEVVVEIETKFDYFGCVFIIILQMTESTKGKKNLTQTKIIKMTLYNPYIAVTLPTVLTIINIVSELTYTTNSTVLMPVPKT